MEIDLNCLNGIRGAAALWVMIFHFILYSKFPLDFQGSSLMPLFFILSGFSLTIAYGAAKQNNDQSADGTNFNAIHFHRNRFARVYPVYLICILFSFPLWMVGYGDYPSTNTLKIGLSVLNSILPLCTFFIFILGSPIDGPGWTICTLALIWLIFPFIYKIVSKLTTKQLVSGLSVMYWLQLVLVFVLFYGLVSTLTFWPAFAASTMHPISRLPIFIMGMLSGELINRSTPNEKGFPTIPWPKSFLLLFPQCFCNISSTDKNDVNNLMLTLLTDGDNADAYWSKRALQQAIFLPSITLLVATLDSVSRYVARNGGIMGSVWFQAMVPFAHLELVVALVCSGSRKSILNTFLRSQIMNWLGKLSMCVYLIHFPVMNYLCWANSGKQQRKWPDVFDCDGVYDVNSIELDDCKRSLEDFFRTKELPVWEIPIAILLSICLAHGLYTFVEEPCRKMLRR